MPASRSRAKPDVMLLPSTSKAHSGDKKETTQSPTSPVGRIAKRNAIKLNEMDLNGRTAAYSENFVGMIPVSLEASDLNEKYPIVARLLDAGEDADDISTDNLNSLQRAVEELLAENVDNLKTLHGEITYLTTGEYPTVELNDRPMPSYTLRPRTPRRSQTEEGLIADLGLNSSPEEEGGDPPSILDVPQRFWSWTREYLRHITEEYLSEFREKVVDRFSDEEIRKLLSKDLPTTKQLNGSSPNKTSTPRANGLTRELMDLQTPTLSRSRIKRRPAYLSEEAVMVVPVAKSARREKDSNSSRVNRTNSTDSGSPVKLQSLVAKVIRTHQNSINSAQKSCQNGFEVEWSNDEEEDSNQDAWRANGGHPRLNGACDDVTSNGFHISPPLSNGGNVRKTDAYDFQSNCGSPPSCARIRSDDLNNIGKALVSLGVQKGILPKRTDSLLSDDFSGDEKVSPMNMNGLDLNFLSPIHEEGDEPKDEVSRELRRKQRELSELYQKSKPMILELHERIQAEYALYETSRRLDIADDKLFELGAKFERSHSLTKDQRQECKAAVETREKAAQQFYRLRFKTQSSLMSLHPPQKPGISGGRKQSQHVATD